MIYFISDLHFGHENIIPFASRPFEDAEHMDNSLISRWNKKVDKQDTVYILGDFSFYPKTKTASILRKLNGNKVLIEGNHDNKSRIPKECFNHTTPYKEIKIDGRKISLFHYPIAEFNGYYKNAIHLYGHTHFGIYNIKNAYSVCAEVLNYEPCTLEEVIERNKEWRNSPMCIVK